MNEYSQLQIWSQSESTCKPSPRLLLRSMNPRSLYKYWHNPMFYPRRNVWIKKACQMQLEMTTDILTENVRICYMYRCIQFSTEWPCSSKLPVISQEKVLTSHLKSYNWSCCWTAGCRLSIMPTTLKKSSSWLLSLNHSIATSDFPLILGRPVELKSHVLPIVNHKSSRPLKC